MTFYVRPLVIVDEYDNIVYKITKTRVDKAFACAANFLNSKDSRKTISKGFGIWLDDQCKKLLGFENE